MDRASNPRSQQTGRGRTEFTLAPAIIVLLALACSSALLAQQAASSASDSPATTLAITSPAGMTIVHPGEELSVEVAVAPGAVFRSVTVVGEKSFGVSSPLRQAPYRFSFSVPENLSSGPHYFTAVGRAASGEMTASLPLAVDLEIESFPQSLKIDPRGIDLEALGEEIPIRVLGEFAGGVDTDLTRSMLLHFASSNPSVATVSSQGIARAVAPGQARIVANFHLPTGTMSSEISVAVHEFAVRLSANSIDFGSEPAGMESAVRVLTLTNPGDARLQIRDVRAWGDYQASGDCVPAGPLPAGGSCAIAVTFEPSATGPRHGLLAIATGAVSAATEVPLSGIGMAR
jgi:hypothetical protein